MPRDFTARERAGGRGSRRWFVAAIIASGLMPAAAAARATPISRLRVAREQREAIVAGQAEVISGTGYVTVPGARLYYEVSGSGPTLLLIPGGVADAASFLHVAELFAAHYTVVRYDPRGISRSHLEDPAAEVPIETHADDAARLLKAIGGEPAYVLGSSGGAVIGLALAERHPELVQGLVAHEPPVIQLLPEEDARRQGAQEIHNLYQKEGAEAAMGQFMVLTGLGPGEPQGEIPPEAQEAMAREMARLQQNIDFFFAQYYLPIINYVPDITTLQGESPRVVVGVGAESGGQLAHDAALALAERLGTPAVVFPGDHGGPFMYPEETLEQFQELFEAR